MNIIIPDYVNKILDKLITAGYNTYIVGGCVRDILMNKKPSDYDICTSALPLQIKEVFCDCKVIDTGIKHGTVTVVDDDNSFEITTFRTEEKYEDSRHPSAVEFVTDIKKDLARRDFTMNAMAYNNIDGLVDVFGGCEDIKSKIIRCVGDADKRFKEDALRILRALRFSSVTGFDIEKNTAKALLDNKALLLNISAERINSELDKIIMGDNVYKVMTKYRDIIAVIIPEFIPCFDFEQHTKHHCYTVYDHIIMSTQAVARNRILRLTMLFHDIGKPQSFNPTGVKKFADHQIASAEIALKIMKRLKYDNATINMVNKLIIEHDNRYSCKESSVKKYISKFGYDFFLDQLRVRMADTLSQSLYKRDEKLQFIEDTLAMGKKVMTEQSCLSLNELAINGNDLIEIGITDGKQIGKILNTLLNSVIENKVNNTKKELLCYAEKLNG